MRRTEWIVIAALTIGMAPSHAAAKTETPNQRTTALALFQGNPRLRERITLAHKERPLSEVLASLATQLKLRLSASRETASERVTLFLDERPAADVLALIAEQFDFRWSKRGEAYQLEQTLPARRHEAELREAYIQREWDDGLALVRHVDRLSQMTAEQRASRQEEITVALRRPGIPPAEAAALLLEQQAFRDLNFPGAQAGIQLFRALVTPAQLQQVRHGQVIQHSSFDRTLTPEWVTLIEQRSARNLPNAGGEERHADFIVRFQEEIAFENFPDRFYRPHWLLRIEMPFGSPRAYFPLAWTPARSAPQPTPTLDPPDDPLWKREVTLDSRPAPLPGDPADLSRFRRQKLISLGDLAEALHREAGVEIVADGFTRARFPAADFSAKLPVEQVVKKLAQQQYTVRKEANLLHIRNDLFFLDRPKEVPENLLASWRKQITAEKQVTLDHLAALAEQIDGPQLQGLCQWWRGYFGGTPADDPELATQFRRAHRHLQFWAALSPAQRRAALEGMSLPVAQMTGRQRQRLGAALEPSSEAAAPLWLRPKLTAEEVAQLYFHLEQGKLQEQQYQLTAPNGSALQLTQRIDPTKPAQAPNGAVPIGTPTTLDETVFLYSVVGRETPVRRLPLAIRRAEAR